MVPSLVRGVRGAAVFAVLAAALAGCEWLTGGGDRAVEITPERSDYAGGEQARATVTNVSDEDVLYNLCGRQLQRRAGSGWVTVDEEFQICTSDLKRLRPGESVGGLYPLPQTLAAGTYRILFSTILTAESERLPEDERASRPFKVIAPVAQID